MSNGASANPIYGVMGMKWESGTTSGPKFVYITNGVESTKNEYIIPAANGTTASGIVTTTTQTLGGQKTFTSTMYGSSIYPRATRTYDLGSGSYIWNELYHQVTKWYDDGSALNAITNYTTGGASATEGTYGTQGYFNLYLGNDIARSTALNQGAGNSMGRLFFYGSGSGYTYLYSENASKNNYSIQIPATDGNMLISTGATVESLTSYLPFYWTNNKAVKYSDAYMFSQSNGTTTSTGQAVLILGNNKNSTTANNKQGKLKLFNSNTGSMTIVPGTDTTSDYTLYLPGASGQLVYHTNDTAVGNGTNPVYVTAAGKVTASTSNVGGPNTGSTTYKPMHMASGVLTAAAATIGSTTLPVYMNKGEITACSKGDLFSNFSSTAGTSGETLSITVAGQNRTVTLDAASASQGGVVTTGTQDLAGVKKFINTTDSTATSTGAVVVSGGLGVAKQLRVGSTATFSGVINAYGGSVKIGTSGESATLSYDTSTDTLTISFP